MIKKLIISCGILIVLFALLGLSQLWFSFLSVDIFVKLAITFGIIIGIFVVVIMILYHLREEEQQRKDKFLN